MSDIERFAQKIERLSAPQARAEVSRQMGHVAVGLYQRGFQSKMDPYGTPWAPRVDQVRNRSWKTTGNSLLERSGYLKASGEIERADDAGFSMRIYAPYGGFIHFGTRKMVARGLIPSASRGLGTWGAPLTKAALIAMRGMLP